MVKTVLSFTLWLVVSYKEGGRLVGGCKSLLHQAAALLYNLPSLSHLHCTSALGSFTLHLGLHFHCFTAPGTAPRRRINACTKRTHRTMHQLMLKRVTPSSHVVLHKARQRDLLHTGDTRRTAPQLMNYAKMNTSASAPVQCLELSLELRQELQLNC